MAAAPVAHLQLLEAPVHRAPARPLLPELPDQELPEAVHSRARIQGFVIQEPWEGKGTGWPIPAADNSLPSLENESGLTQDGHGELERQDSSEILGLAVTGVWLRGHRGHGGI